MLSAVALCLDGARAASVVDSVDEDIPRVHLPVLLVQAASDLQPAPVALVPEVADSEGIEEEVVALEVTVEASVADLEDPLEVEVEEEVVSDTRTDMLLPKVLPPDHEEVDEEEEAVSAAEVEDDMETTGHHVVVVVVVATEIGTWAPVAPTTNPSDVIALQNVVVAVVVIEEAATVEATEVVTKTAVTAMVGMVAETTATARENVLMRANTTTGARDEGTKLKRLRVVYEWVCQKVTFHFFALSV
jgi:hypothetical protein